MINALEKSKEKEKENKEQLRNLKAELIKKEYQDNLKEHLENRLLGLTDKLKDMKGSPSIIELKTIISEKSLMGATPKYTNTELAILFDYYKEFIQEINKKTKYLPSKQNFCSFAGISTRTYDAYRQSNDAERRDIIQQIEDYITDIMLTSAQTGEVKEVTTMFRTKTEHGYIEASAPIVIEHKSDVNIDDIKKQIEAVNKGKSLKTIELKQDENGIYTHQEE